jgi:polysaccharide export outer membrane protein
VTHAGVEASTNEKSPSGDLIVVRHGVKGAMNVGKVMGWCLVGALFSAFLPGCAENIKYPVDYSPPTSFLLGPEDVLVVTVWKNQDLSREVVIRPDGMISMPLIGDIKAAGLSSDVLAKRITERLTEFMSSPTVSVQVKEVNSYFIYVMGEVLKPGKYQLKSYATVLQGVSLAGGFTPFASRNKMVVVRNIEDGGGEKRELRIPAGYSDLTNGTGPVGNFVLKSGDIIVVP